MDDITHRQQRFLAYFQGVGLGLIGLAFFAQPLMRFAHPGGLLLSGLMIAAGVAMSYLQFAFRWNGKSVDLFGSGLVIGGLFALCMCAIQAYQVSQANDADCKAIEADMLSATPKISDGPAKFQALMCRPVRGGIVIK